MHKSNPSITQKKARVTSQNDILKSKNPNLTVKVESLNYETNNQKVLNEINFEIFEGEYVGLIGANGSGKTTLLRLILGMLSPSSGQILIYDEIPKKAILKGIIGYVPQNLSLETQAFPATVEEIIRNNFKSSLFDRDFYQQSAKIEEVLSISGIENLKHKQFAELSGGQKQRVLIARSLLNKPKILLLDEPTSGVDLPSQDSFYSFISDLNKKEKLTILFVSHDLEAISTEASRILCIDKKKINEQSADEVERQIQHFKVKIEHAHP